MLALRVIEERLVNKRLLMEKLLVCVKLKRGRTLCGTDLQECALVSISASLVNGQICDIVEGLESQRRLLQCVLKFAALVEPVDIVFMERTNPSCKR
jgi:hypothetical protein